MSLSFAGTKGTVERRWIEYAMLRDNVQHHLERGTPAGAFPNLHRISEALGGRTVELSAKGLHEELTRARGLLERPVAELAISQRTRAAVELQWPPSGGDSTTLLATSGLTSLLSGREKVAGDVFGGLLEALLTLTEGATDVEKLHVQDL